MRIKSHASWLPFSFTAAAIVTLGIVISFLYLKSAEGPVPTGMLLFLIPFLAVGLILGFVGVRGLTRLAWYGNWALDFPENGVCGQTVTATLFPRRKVVPQGDVTCRLRCLQTSVDDNRPEGLTPGATRQPDVTRHTTLFEKSWTVSSSPIDPHVGIALQVPLPATGAATAVNSNDGSGIRWQLNVVVQADGISHESAFDIPVLSSPRLNESANAGSCRLPS